jgi:glycosyltransferase involved in cell wall biosynthesis
LKITGIFCDRELIKNEATMKKVSVVIPVYNRERTILRAINSVFSQTYPVFEVVVVDDGSSDETLGVLANIRDPRLRVIALEKNSGASKARNIGVRRSEGDVIAFQDSDDEWYPEKLMKQIQAMEKYKADLVCSSYIQHYQGKKSVLPLRRFDGPVSFNDLLLGNMVGTPCLIGKKECFLKVPFREDLLCLDDWNLALELARRYKIWFLNTPLANAYLQSNSMSLKTDRLIPAYNMIYDINKEFIDLSKESRRDWLISVYNAKISSGMSPFPELWEALTLKWDAQTFRRCVRYALKIKMSNIFNFK